VAVDASGSVYVADQNNDRIQEIAAGGNVQMLAGTGSPGFNGDGLPSVSTQLFSPGSMTLTANGTLYFSDAGNGRVRSVSAAGAVSTVVQITARGVAVDGAGNV
jgi:sugar lactone lactonase YvrE